MYVVRSHTHILIVWTCSAACQTITRPISHHSTINTSNHTRDVGAMYIYKHIHICTHLHKLLIVSVYQSDCGYGVATISRLLKIIGLFCKRALSKRRYSAKETNNFKEPTNRSHPIYFCRVAKTHRMHYLHRLFSAKEPYDSWLFCGK